MKVLTALVVLVLFPGISAAARPSDAGEWYEQGYAAMWKKNSWDKLEAIARYYDTVITVHDDDGDVRSIQSRPWLESSIRGWKADGWLGSDVPVLQVDMLNAYTAMFKSRWRDRYKDGSEEFSCAWYMADWKNDAWVFTAFAEIDCDDHGL